MFGVGPDAGQTTIRLRHAWGNGTISVAACSSAFMDVDVFPNILEYWGPNGMLFFRNAQIFWEPIDSGKTNLRIALERPGASADVSNFADRVELQNVKPHFRFRSLRRLQVQRQVGIRATLGDTARHPLGPAAGGHARSQRPRNRMGNEPQLEHQVSWQDVLRLQINYGAGIQNYFNDAPVDVRAEFNLRNRRTPLTGEALPIVGGSAYLDHYWNPRVTSAIGISWVNIDNSDAQPASAYHNGEYASTNLLWVPVTNVLMGAEFQYGRRVNVADGWSFNDIACKCRSNTVSQRI
jgi:hypothetical protein